MSDPMGQVWDATPVGMPKIDAHNAAMAKARDVLVEALVRDFVQSMYDDGAYSMEVARNGHRGYSQRPFEELVQYAIDMGLDDQFPAVAEAIAFLEANSP